MSQFYLRRLEGCSEPGCKRAATQEVIGPRNESYGKACDRHAKRHLASLEKVHARVAPEPIIDLMAALKKSLATPHPADAQAAAVTKRVDFDKPQRMES